MRILMLNNEFPPLGGGTGTVNQALLKRWARVPGLEIELITSALKGVPEEEQFAEHVRIYKVPVNNKNIHHSSNRELVTFALRSFLLARQRMKARPFDFCFAWSAVPAGAVAMALRRLYGLGYLVRVCGPDIPGFERRYGPMYRLLTPAIRAVWHGAKVVVAKCEREADMIRSADRNVTIGLVPNGVELAAFPAAPAVSDSGPLHLICVARLIERKGQSHLIQAVKRLADRGIPATLELVGTGDAQPEYERLVRELGVADRVQFSGYVAREAIAAHYAAAQVFVLPSYNEGMSVATLEAMAAGLALVVTRTGGTAELVEENVNGMSFDWADIAALSAHLERLAGDRDLVRRMGQASRLRAAKFSWDAGAEAFLEIFSQMATPIPVLERGYA